MQKHNLTKMESGRLELKLYAQDVSDIDDWMCQFNCNRVPCVPCKYCPYVGQFV